MSENVSWAAGGINLAARCGVFQRQRQRSSCGAGQTGGWEQPPGAVAQRAGEKAELTVLGSRRMI